MTSHKEKDSDVTLGRGKLHSIAAVFAAVVLAGFTAAITSSTSIAQASVITPEEHWKYNVYWYWDTDERETVGLITPSIVIENETSDRLEGYVADANGTRLEMYDGEQVVKAKYGYDEGASSEWELASWIYDGYFAIDIPEKYRDADYIGLYVGANSYSVDDGDINTMNAWVSINSVRMDYRLDNTLVSAAEEEPPEDAKLEPVADASPAPGSLIDMILSKFGML